MQKQAVIHNNVWPMLEKAVYNMGELESILDVSRTTIWRVQKQGFLKKLPGFVTARIPRTEVIRYLESAGDEDWGGSQWLFRPEALTW